MSQAAGTPADSPVVEDDCPLPSGSQTRNIVLFAGYWCLFYLAAPVTYVGLTHANLLKAVGNSDTTANLPHAVYQWLTAVPILIAWFFPQPRALKPLLVGSLLCMATASGLVALVIGLSLLLPANAASLMERAMWLVVSARIVTLVVIAHAAVFGVANGVMLTTLWEVLRRGVSTARRGQALGVTFGVGPLLACLASLGQQALFAQQPLWGLSFGLEFPRNYLALFAAAVPIMLLETAIVAAFIIPLPREEAAPADHATAILSGLREFFTSRPLVVGAIAYVLVYSGGNAIFDNVSLHAQDVLGKATASTVGTQNFLRFGFKAVAGVLFGYLLAKTHAKANLLATTAVLLIGLAWALNVQGWWYLISAGLLGAGELFGAYFPNYIATASRKSQVRANMAYLSLIGALVGFASVLFGQIADRYGRIASFQTAAGILVVAMILIAVALPARPTPREDE